MANSGAGPYEPDASRYQVWQNGRPVPPPPGGWTGGPPGNAGGPGGGSPGGQVGNPRVAGGAPGRAAPPPPGARPDPGFFKQFFQALNGPRMQIRGALGLSGMAVVLALDVLATLNVGNPWLFIARRDTWKELSGAVAGNSNDVWMTWFNDVNPHWTGHAAQQTGYHVRFVQDKLFPQLSSVARDMSDTMNHLRKEVVDYDLWIFTVYAATAPILSALAKMRAHPMGMAAFIAEAGAFGGFVGKLIKEFADVYNAYEGDLNKLEMKLYELRASFYRGGDPARGPRNLDLDPELAERSTIRDYWVPAPNAAPATGPSAGDHM
ncbi:hypothetical protein Misp01_01470 [Microtetraspora sp. NBRC 13810]|uniref:hypothetical protein n=1 Tax=Microtetraspora sp. NBRC 13810 TaxID=3030990 RepID=UPI0024A41868|nr:hypothetical protein [Microtetraspora sp. NBRC 13810]GLW05017.1 hypothetical protein Misp01_01470 [Microtetraspora sp. NBRC 13810]